MSRHYFLIEQDGVRFQIVADVHIERVDGGEIPGVSSIEAAIRLAIGSGETLTVVSAARAAHCSTQQARRYLQAMVESGEVVVVERGGSGRGRARRYALK